MVLAASAASLAGDTIQIDGIVISLMITDWTTTMWATIGEAIRTLVEGLRVSIPLVPNTVAGTIRNDGGQIPVAILEPHYKFTGLSDGTQYVRSVSGIDSFAGFWSDGAAITRLTITPVGSAGASNYLGTDNMSIGYAPVPAPGAIAIVLVAGLGSRRRRA